MARYRIGNDITIIWSVNDKDGSAFPLVDKDVHLYYTCERGRFEADIDIQGNVIAWEFLGKDQRTLGGYTLSLQINQSNGKRTIRRDISNAFVLVGKGCEESPDCGDADINEGGEITLATELDVYRVSPVIPHIENGEWWVDDVSTGKPASYTIGANGNWWIGDVDTGEPASYHIGENGNWYAGDEDTGKPARGEKGDVVDAAYMEFEVEEDMNLYLSFLSTNDQLELEFNINEEGYLTVDK